MEMENDGKEKVDGEVDEEIEEPEALKDENDNDITDWEALAKKQTGIAKRYQTKFKKLKDESAKTKPIEPEATPQDKKEDKKEFDLAEESFLLTKGIKENEFNLVLEEMKSSGKSLKEVINSKYFQEKREMLATEDATPSRTNRAGGGTKNEVEYWLQKGQLPPDTPENRELRRKVAKARATHEENIDKFSKIPIISASKERE